MNTGILVKATTYPEQSTTAALLSSNHEDHSHRNHRLCRYRSPNTVSFSACHKIHRSPLSAAYRFSNPFQIESSHLGGLCCVRRGGVEGFGGGRGLYLVLSILTFSLFSSWHIWLCMSFSDKPRRVWMLQIFFVSASRFGLPIS